MNTIADRTDEEQHADAFWERLLASLLRFQVAGFFSHGPFA